MIGERTNTKTIESLNLTSIVNLLVLSLWREKNMLYLSLEKPDFNSGIIYRRMIIFFKIIKSLIK